MTKAQTRKEKAAAHLDAAKAELDGAKSIHLEDANDALALLTDKAGVAFIEKLRKHVEESTDCQTRREATSEGQEGSAVTVDRIIRAYDLAVAAVPQRVAALTPASAAPAVGEKPVGDEA